MAPTTDPAMVPVFEPFDTPLPVSSPEVVVVLVPLLAISGDVVELTISLSKSMTLFGPAGEPIFWTVSVCEPDSERLVARKTAISLVHRSHV